MLVDGDIYTEANPMPILLPIPILFLRDRKFSISSRRRLQKPTMRMCRTAQATVRAQVEALYIYWFCFNPTITSCYQVMSHNCVTDK